MASGTPMAGYRLPGIPDEYYNYIYEIPESKNGLCDELKMIMQMTEQQRNEMGLRASEFIRREKNAKVQCRKIMDLINRLP